MVFVPFKWKRHVWRLSIACSFVVLAVFLLFSSYQLLRAAFVLYTYSGRQGPLPVRAYIASFGHPFGQTEFTLQGTAGPISMRLFTPLDRRHPEPIVLIHGFAPLGNHDEHLTFLASCLARVGFLVAVPTVPGETESHMRTSDLVVIEDAIHWTAQNSKQRVAVFGISFGGGLAVPAAAHPSVADEVKLVFSFSGYNDMDRIGRYYLGERVVDPDGDTYKGHGPDIGRVLVFADYLGEMVPAEDYKALHAVLEKMSRNLWKPLAADDPALRALSDRQRGLLDDLTVMRTREMHEQYANAAHRHRAEAEAMSPSSVLSHMRMPFFAISSTNDAVFPVGEAEWTARQTSGNLNAHVLISPWLNHGFVGRSAPLSDKFRVGLFFARVLEVASRRSNL